LVILPLGSKAQWLRTGLINRPVKFRFLLLLPDFILLSGVSLDIHLFIKAQAFVHHDTSN
jgi:hypothetical protein